MPVKRSKDSKGPFYQWGDQKKYRYTPGNIASRNAAKSKAHKQGVAISMQTGKWY